MHRLSYKKNAVCFPKLKDFIFDDSSFYLTNCNSVFSTCKVNCLGFFSTISNSVCSFLFAREAAHSMKAL